MTIHAANHAAATANQAAVEAYCDLHLVLDELKTPFPEMVLTDTADGGIRINLGRVDTATAAGLAYTLQVAARLFRVVAGRCDTVEPRPIGT
ncbi:hypothetical protein ACFY12_28425 [Streptomyces sp. NPDC001339]|uniref:hypothetical protein n=1 Tax=Streptomyces sp. NPDC001339 TaxID=3364563 RepID=UPI0036B90146